MYVHHNPIWFRPTTRWGSVYLKEKIWRYPVGDLSFQPLRSGPLLSGIRVRKWTCVLWTFSLFYSVTRAFVHSDSHSGSDAFSHDVKVAAPGYKIGSIACLFHTSSLSISLFTLSPAFKMSLFGTFENVATQEATDFFVKAGKFLPYLHTESGNVTFLSKQVCKLNT